MINGLIIITTTLVAIPIIYYFVDRIVTNKRIKENQIAWDNFSKNMTYDEKIECYLKWCNEQRWKKGGIIIIFQDFKEQSYENIRNE